MTSKEEQNHFLRLSQKAEEAVELMLSGFSSAIYGCGSKRMVLDGIAGIIKSYSGPTDYIVRIRGYDQTFPMIRTITSALFSSGGRGRSKANSIRTQAEVLRSMEKLPKSARVFILIDSIDAAPMKGNQEFFSKLACMKNVHLCASVDHCRAGLLWSPPQVRRCKWVWVEANTYHAYSAEVKDLLHCWDDLIEGKADAASKSLAVVLSSLTGSHKEAIQSIAKMQLDMMAANTRDEDADGDNAAAAQIRSVDLVKRFKRQMIADNLLKMRSLLQELIDHRLVLNSKDKETGNEVYWLPFDKERLERLVSGAEFT